MDDITNARTTQELVVHQEKIAAEIVKIRSRMVTLKQVESLPTKREPNIIRTIRNPD